MVKYFSRVLALIIASSFSACDNCIGFNGRCADEFSFKIIDKTTRQDAVFGANPIYNKDSVYLFSDYGGYIRRLSQSHIDKLVYAAYIPFDTMYLRLTHTDNDTLIMNYEFIDSRCCNGRYKGFGKLKTILFNGSTAGKEGETFVFEK
jgi:hypothetical protein